MRTLFIMRRIIVQTINDKRSLGLILIVPLFLFTLIYFLLGETDYHAVIAHNGMPSQLIEVIEAEAVTVKELSIEAGMEEVKEKKIDALLYKEGDETVLLMETNDTVKAGVIQKAIQKGIKKLNPAGVMRVDFLYGDSDDTMFNSLGYVLLGVISFFLIFILAGISFVRERTNQTMERLMITPVKRWQVVLGYTLGFGVFAMLQSIILLCYVTGILNMTILGSIILAGFVMILLSMSAVCIGAFCSIFANNEFQIMQFIPVVVIPQIFFSGLISLDTLPYNLGILSKIMPVYYACNALEGIIVKGAGIKDVLSSVVALILFIGLFFVLNIFALKKYRKI
ncbi:MAG: transport system permease protein [Herbinix sp.]|jgi:ABC-2 type transport system permease protein|nr:transport system permease protein [Herbinix sp.]